MVSSKYIFFCLVLILILTLFSCAALKAGSVRKQSRVFRILPSFPPFTRAHFLQKRSSAPLLRRTSYTQFDRARGMSFLKHGNHITSEKGHDIGITLFSTSQAMKKSTNGTGLLLSSDNLNHTPVASSSMRQTSPNTAMLEHSSCVLRCCDQVWGGT